MANAKVHYFHSTRHPRKPWRIEIEVEGGDDPYTLDVHGRFKNKREAGYVGRDIACRYDSFSEDWGRLVVEDTPPEIETID